MSTDGKVENGENDNSIAQRIATGSGTAAKQQPSQNRTNLAAETRRIAAMIGDIVAVLSRDPNHNEMPLKGLHETVLPAAALGRCAIAYSSANNLSVQLPVAIVLWSIQSDAFKVEVSGGDAEACAQILKQLYHSKAFDAKVTPTSAEDLGR